MAAGPLLKWPGGKGAELESIMAAAPRSFARYFEPFLGGGAVFFAVPPGVPAFVNDSCADLMELYALVRAQDREFLDLVEALDEWWERLERFVAARSRPLMDAFLARPRPSPSALGEACQALVRGHAEDAAATVPQSWAELRRPFRDDVCELVPAKVARMRGVEGRRAATLPVADVRANLEGAYKAACYTTLRRAYNESRRQGSDPGRQAARFLFLREYAYAAMFRFNRRGEFNVPYGGITYNRKRLRGKLARLRDPGVVARLRGAVLACGDFEAFLDAHPPGPDDFVFFDPPYDSDFSAYDQRSFNLGDHERLADVMARLPARVQLVIKATPAVERLYARDGWWMRTVDKRYPWTIKERNDRRATHLVITNYEPPGPRSAGAASAARDGVSAAEVGVELLLDGG